MERNLKHIKKVYIELHSYCNRKCDWCPNKIYLRNKYEEMSDEMFSSILSQLNEEGFGKYDPSMLYPSIALLGYNEPFYNIELLKKRIDQIFNTCDNHIKVETTTNGDYLTKDSFEKLNLNTLLINDYDNKGIKHWENKLEEMGCVIVDMNENKELIYAIHEYVGLIMCQCNWTNNRALENRGGILTPDNTDYSNIKWRNNLETRSLPCIETITTVNIDYKGNIMPCCHIRNDCEYHTYLTMGNVSENKIIDIINNDKMKKFSMQLDSESNFPETCKYCHKERHIIHSKQWKSMENFE